MKKHVIGDIHGRFEALKQVLRRSRFHYKNDKLIVLGDIVDGGINTYKVVEELLKIKNLIFVLGNHDEWFMHHIASGWADEIWIQQGGANTLRSYGAKVKESDFITDDSFIDTRDLNIPVTHQHFFNRAVYYHIEDDMLFVHGGFNPKIPKIESQSKHDLLWDRDLIKYAERGNIVPGYKKVFVGHTTTQNRGFTQPIKFNNLTMMDCGAGGSGKLAIMNIDTEEFWLSEQQEPVWGRI